MTEDNEADLQLTYRNTIFVALSYLAAALEPYVKEQLQRRYRDAWQDNVSKTQGHESSLTDAYVLLRTVYDRWNSAFNTCFKAPRSVVKELRDDRNAATHHGEPFTADRFKNSISSMLHLLRSVPSSEETDKAIEKIERLRQQPLHQDTTQHLLNGNKKTETLNIEGQQTISALQTAVPLGEPDTALGRGQQDRGTPVQKEQKIEQSQIGQTVSAKETPTIIYDYNRLCFKAKHIEPLTANQAFRVVTPVGIFQMTKAEFYSAFPKVVVSKSYTESGIYHYPSVPKSALPYKLPE